jgi:CRISPR-associated protein Cmr3
MNNINQWLLLDPLDTLFFRGSESMVAGEDHEVRSVFPPMPATLTGALTTTILQQRSIRPEDFVQEKGPATKITSQLPLLGIPGRPGFRVLGPLFQAEVEDNEVEWFFPAPAHWFAPISDTAKDRQQVEVHPGQVLSQHYQALGMSGRVSKPVWVPGPPREDFNSLAGMWVNQAALSALTGKTAIVTYYPRLEKVEQGKPAMVPLRALFENELRVGIALQSGIRRAKTGHLYSATQVRLTPGVRLAIGLDTDLIPSHLDSEGILSLGGEQRLVHYQQYLTVPDIPTGSSPWVMALAPQLYALLEELGWADLPRASGPLLRVGGWDMQKGFHKDMVAYLPAGTVIQVPLGTTLPFGFIRL